MKLFSRRGLLFAAALAIPLGSFALTAPASAETVLRVIPHADLKNIDPIWTTAYITRNHGFLVYDTLFAMDEALNPQPQMVDTWSTSDDSLQDNSRQVETVFATAQQGDIIIADHFEMTLQKTRHQLFASWSTDGIDKQLNLIIASSIEGFNELRQLSQHYQVPVQSFQQMPFSADEVDAFVGFYLFPDDPLGKLSIPASLRGQLAASQGAVGKVIDIIERDGTQVKYSPTTDSASMRQGSRIIAAVLILFLLAIGGGWYYLG